MDFLSSFYPSLSARSPLPALHAPLLFSLGVTSYLLPRNTLLRALTILPPYAYLLLTRPLYTAGSPADNYSSVTVYFFYPLAFIDFGLLSPALGRAPRFIGPPTQTPQEQKQQNDGDTKPLHAATYGEEDCPSIWARVRWAFYLQSSARGIGWDWQVKNVPVNPDADLDRWAFVRKHAAIAAKFWALKCVSVYGLGAIGVAATEGWGQWVKSVGTGWLAAAYGYQTLAQLFHLLAAATVAVGVCAPWEWPPVFGPLREAWSVRQMWSVVWHQNLRRAVQQPGIHLSRFLGLAKGTLGSKYFQLYVAFGISMLSHQWNIFNAVRADVGEARFFLSQAVIITLEDFVQWCWRKASGRTDKDELLPIERAVGWIWTFAWFSYSLPAWASGMFNAGVIARDPDTAWALALGREHNARFLL